MEPLRLNYIYGGDALQVLRGFPDESVDTCVTSPPYYGLRDYGTEPLVWGGNPKCDHQWGKALQSIGHKAGNKEALSGFQQHAEVAKFGGLAQLGEERKSNMCTKCSAWKGHLGGEPTPELYIEHLKDILSEVHRVLKPWGLLFLNIGDSYVGSGKGAANYPGNYPKQNSNKGSLSAKGMVGFVPCGLKPKDLCMVPARVALALQADGWWLRSDIIWAKPNPMPESVNNRPISAHEYIFMFVKNAGEPIFWRHENGIATSKRPKPDHRWRLREPIKRRVKQRGEGELLETEREEIDHMETSQMPKGWDTDKEVRRKWSRSNLWEGIYYYYDIDAVRQPHQQSSIERYKSGHNVVAPSDGKIAAGSKTGAFHSERMGDFVNPAGANLRSVWEISTQSYKGPHYAAFPEELPRRCILASTSEKGNCVKCGKPWVRTMQTLERAGHKSRIDEENFKCGSGEHKSSLKVGVGWHPTCKCNEEVEPCLVLDPFCGTGTTLKVATSLGRNFVGIELSRKYIEKQAKARTAQRGIHEAGISTKTPKTRKKRKSNGGVPPKTRKSFRCDRAPVVPT